MSGGRKALSVLAVGSLLAALQFSLLKTPAMVVEEKGSERSPGAIGYSIEPVGNPLDNRVVLSLYARRPELLERSLGIELVRPADITTVGPVTAPSKPITWTSYTVRRRMLVNLQVHPGVWKLKINHGRAFGAVHVLPDRVPDS